MSQREIYELLLSKRNAGDEEYYTANQIGEMLSEKTNRVSLYYGIRALCNSGHLEYNREELVLNILNNRGHMKRFRAVYPPKNQKLCQKPEKQHF